MENSLWALVLLNKHMMYNEIGESMNRNIVQVGAYYVGEVKDREISSTTFALNKLCNIPNNIEYILYKYILPCFSSLFPVSLHISLNSYALIALLYHLFVLAITNFLSTLSIRTSIYLLLLMWSRSFLFAFVESFSPIQC